MPGLAGDEVNSCSHMRPKMALAAEVGEENTIIHPGF